MVPIGLLRVVAALGLVLVVAADRPPPRRALLAPRGDHARSQLGPIKKAGKAIGKGASDAGKVPAETEREQSEGARKEGHLTAIRMSLCFGGRETERQRERGDTEREQRDRDGDLTSRGYAPRGLRKADRRRARCDALPAVSARALTPYHKGVSARTVTGPRILRPLWMAAKRQARCVLARPTPPTLQGGYRLTRCLRIPGNH